MQARRRRFPRRCHRMPIRFNAVVSIAAKTDLYDLARERRLMPAEPFEHVAVEVNETLEAKR
jgi:hypothetical protein